MPRSARRRYSLWTARVIDSDYGFLRGLVVPSTDAEQVKVQACLKRELKAMESLTASQRKVFRKPSDL